MSVSTSFCYDRIKHCPSALFITGVCMQTSTQQCRTNTSKYTHTMSPQSEMPVTATMSGAKLSRRYEETFFYLYIKYTNTNTNDRIYTPHVCMHARTHSVRLVFMRLWVRVPLGQNLYNSPCARAYGRPPFTLSKNTHTRKCTLT